MKFAVAAAMIIHLFLFAVAIYLLQKFKFNLIDEICCEVLN